MEHTQKVVLTPYESETPPVLIPSTDTSTQYTSMIPKQNVSTVTQTISPQTMNTGTQTIKRMRSHPYGDKFENQIKIAVLLGIIGGIDRSLRIKNENGIFIENSNLINLLHNATQPAKRLIGQESFIKLLHKAGIEPDMIANEDIKAKLINLYETQTIGTQTESREPQIFSNVSPEQMNVDPVIQSKKRQRDEDDDDENENEEPATKKTNWIIPEK
jgi:hypothetical protein